MNKGSGKYECVLCKRDGLLRSAETPEEFSRHMKEIHGATVDPHDIRWLETQMAAKELAGLSSEDERCGCGRNSDHVGDCGFRNATSQPVEKA